MPDLPIMLSVAGRRCLVVGGGAVALRRAKSLLDCGANVVVVAPGIDERFASLAGVTIHKRQYERADLDGALLVVTATDDAGVNRQVAEDAQALGVLVNRTDAADETAVSIPAHIHADPVTLAVHTGGVSAAAAATIRDELAAALDPNWPRLLSLVAPYRDRVQATIHDAGKRQAVLRRLADAQAMALLKSDGEQAVRDRCESLLAGG